MVIKWRCENGFLYFNIEIESLCKWLNISISENESQEDFEKRIQEEIDIQYNRPEYNNMHKQHRHMGYAMMNMEDGSFELNTEEAIMANAKDKSIYTKDLDEMEEKIFNDWEYENYCNSIKEVLKPKAAEMVIAIVLDGLSVGEYALKIGDKPNNVSHRFNTAKKKLRKIFKTRPFYHTDEANN